MAIKFIKYEINIELGVGSGDKKLKFMSFFLPQKKKSLNRCYNKRQRSSLLWLLEVHAPIYEQNQLSDIR
jgi:hypothetical protein